MLNPPQAALTLYLSGALALTGGIKMGQVPEGRPVSPLSRGLARGEVAPGIPRLDPRDGMANAALLMAAVAGVPNRTPAAADPEACEAAPRTFALLLDGRISRVRFGARAVCQLRLLKRISVAQPGFGHRGLGEVAAFVMGRRLADSADVDVSRVVVPPFRFTGDTVTFLDADLGKLWPGEQMIGTFHTHPEGDIEQGVLSSVDLHFMRSGHVDFHGEVGSLRKNGPGLDWLFDIVETRDGDWNVYAHDRTRFEELLHRCALEAECPVNDLRLAGSRYYLLIRHYEEREAG